MQTLNIIILLFFLVAASYTDIKKNIIPNRITFPMIIYGFVSMSITSGIQGLQTSLFGFLLGFAVFFIPFIFHAMGAGDVKLMAGVGAMIGFQLTISALLYTAVCGAVVLFVMTCYRRRLHIVFLALIGVVITPIVHEIYQRTNNRNCLKIEGFFQSFQLDAQKKYIPYGVAISIGTVIVISGLVPRVL